MSGTSPSSASGSGYLVGRDPRTFADLPQVPVTSAADLRSQVSRARTAQGAWGALALAERARLLKKAAKRLLAERADGLAIVQAEVGKVAADALFTEVLGPLDAVNGWLRVIESAPSGPVALNPLAFPKKKARIELVPRGLIAVIAPWNFPIAGLYRSVFPALLLGNAVIVKPSEHSPRSSGWFLRLLSEVLPVGVVEVVQGDGTVGELLLGAEIDACVFTGSSRVGALVEETCQRRALACSAEMGGNDAAIVLEDADLPRTVAGLTHWALQNAGQACGAVEVVYVDSRIASELTARLTDAFRRLRAPAQVGGPGSLAPVAFPEQLDRVMAQIQDAKELGATVETGGLVHGLFLEPTVLSGCTDQMAVVREETFGPVLPVVIVDGAADAIRRVNAGKYGLTASLWTRDMARAERLAAKLDVGVVTVNNHAFTGAIPQLPWSGRRASGRGIAGSAWSLLTFARPKVIVLDRSQGPEPFWMPFDAKLEELGQLLADVQHGRVLHVYKLPALLAARAKAVKAFFGLD